jgi:hypothetical protein
MENVPEVLSAARSEIRSGRNNNRYRTGFGQESSVSAEAILSLR